MNRLFLLSVYMLAKTNERNRVSAMMVSIVCNISLLRFVIGLSVHARMEGRSLYIVGLECRGVQLLL